MTTTELFINDRRYPKGLFEVADGCFAYLQPDGGWGWSNAAWSWARANRCWSTRCSICT